jgi:hypothetical protein
MVGVLGLFGLILFGSVMVAVVVSDAGTKEEIFTGWCIGTTAVLVVVGSILVAHLRGGI